MSWSLGEVAALVLKAARGAGLDWGVAEELAWAVRWLSARGQPGAEAAAVLLAAGPGQSSLALGMALADSGGPAAGAGWAAVRAPLLLAPFAARTLTAGQGVVLSAGPMSLALGAADATRQGPVPELADVTLAAATPPPAAAPRHRVETLARDARHQLETLAGQHLCPGLGPLAASGRGGGPVRQRLNGLRSFFTSLG